MNDCFGMQPILFCRQMQSLNGCTKNLLKRKLQIYSLFKLQPCIKNYYYYYTIKYNFKQGTSGLLQTEGLYCKMFSIDWNKSVLIVRFNYDRLSRLLYILLMLVNYAFIHTENIMSMMRNMLLIIIIIWVCFSLL